MSAASLEQASPIDRSPSVSNHRNYRRYFVEFLPTIVGQLMLPDLKELSTQVEIVVTDSGDSPWLLIVEEGKLAYIGHEGPESPSRFILDIDTLLEVVSAQISPQDAFFAMRIEIEKDIERGLELSVILEAFFENFPFDIS